VGCMDGVVELVRFFQAAFVSLLPFLWLERLPTLSC
jgi:hypothetical protein